MIESFNTSKISVANSEQQLDGEHFLTDIEKHKLLVEWNDTARDYPQDKCIHELFEATVERTPLSVAVVFEGEQLTYRELNARANQLAHYLQTLGVGPEVLVGICVERSLEMVVGVLGILKAGGAYVPLDPTYPLERLAFMLEDSSVPVLLTQSKLVEKLTPHSARVICLDSDWSEIAFHSKDYPSSTVRPENLAYVIYTSGSTGFPKGVLIQHRSLVNYTTAANAEYKISECDRVLQFSSISFDVSAEEIYTCLTCGGTLVLRTDSMLDSVSIFLQKCWEWKLTVLALPTAYWHELTARLSQENFVLPPSLRLIIIGGEKALTERWKTWLENVGPRVRLVNNYGPTEATVGATICDLSAINPALGELPIGRPISNVQIYILDRYLQPVPIGVPGELHIGGDGLARGYLNRPDLTEEKFIPNPFSHQPNSRLYKTGDLARYLPDGNIEYISRIDNQVKIRGFRIELGEIEAVLSQHPEIRETVVIARENVAGGKQLVAYVVPDQEAAPAISELRRFVREKLPDYMVPSAFVILSTLPLTPNGKVDRQSLPAPDINSLIQKSNFVAPRTSTEELVASIWAKVLGVEQVGINDNFFELGGHSILAIQLLSLVSDAYGVDIPLSKLFEAPTVAEIIPFLQQANIQTNTTAIAPISRTENKVFPLSFAQQRLWFLNQLQPNNASYNIPFGLNFSGQLNIPALESSLQLLINRHESLRTNFSAVNGEPVQAIATTRDFTLPVIDLRPLPASERELEYQKIADRAAMYVFNLAQEPLLRTQLVQLTATESVLLLTIHHIIFDGWSVNIFLKELSIVYSALVEERAPTLPEIRLQYVDFAVWQQQSLQREALKSQLAYWQQKLALMPALLELPSDRPRRAVQSFRGATQVFTIQQDISEALVSLSQQQGVTLFILLLTAFKILLYRYTNQSDIVVGTPVANRQQSQIQEMIGFFVNTLVLRTDLSDNPTFLQLLKQVRVVALEAYDCQNLPFEKLVEALQPERNLSYTPLFQVSFTLYEPIPTLTLKGLTISTSEVGVNHTAKFDLSLLLQKTEQGLTGVFEYNTDLFDDGTIARMTGHFQTLLEAIVANPRQSISQLPLFTATERQQLLVDWNNTFVEYPQDKCIHQLFEQQVERSPNAIALVFEGEQLTYLELNARANQLAHYLQTLGVGAEVLVGICVERSLDMIVGILGILKAGGAYVPIDPAYPTERIAYILSDSRLPILLTQQKLVAFLPEHQARIVYLDSDREEIATKHELPPISDVTPENLAYVIYTSGSTGKPKGVKVAHRGLCNLATAQIKLFDVKPDSRILQFASLSFDASISEIVMALCARATLCLGTSESLQPGQPLLWLLQSQRITHVTLVPSALAALPTQELPALQNIVVAGELCPANLVASWAVGRRFFNAYGPTETTVCATVAQCFEGNGAPPIGRPINNTQIYILDRYLQPVPIGVPGELHISSVGLARGYLNRPDLTDEKFIPNPFSNQPNSCLYKTGDLARYLTDGKIEFLGRLDNQVKIRGFRIELGEIEAVLSQHPTIRETVVIARVNSAGDLQLVAYVVPHQEPAPTNSDLRHFLKEQLPEYMIPSAFVVLEALPLTPNGKVDRQSLPAPDINSLIQKTDFVAPRTPIEELVASIWVKVLGVEKIGINDNFFELGGHSLLATQLLSQVRDACEVELPLSKFFEAPTVANLTNYIEFISWASQSLETSNNTVNKREEVEF
ncbi:MAG: amino acid adenylation domain-containing protein [Stigonema ocellatum SAG 48.90 = DSM 106950]|nr:amino acid adenylation domain-containing protein [Stigonema ocellatum SAG 48.90 = DSM 106950]